MVFIKKTISKYTTKLMISAFEKGMKTVADLIYNYPQNKILIKKNHNNPVKIKILDVGCGDGTLTLKICEKTENLDIYGIDILDKTDKKINYKKTNLEYQEFPYKDGEFDIVFSNQVIEHMLNKYRFIKEKQRVLKKDGLFICATENISSLDNILSLIFGQEPLCQHSGAPYVTNSFLSPNFRNKAKYIKQIELSHKNVSSYYGLKRIVKLAGFNNIKQKTFGNILPVPIYGRVQVIWGTK